MEVSRLKQAVSVRDLYGKLGLAPGRFKDWCKRHLEKQFENGLEWTLLPHVKNPQSLQRNIASK